MTVATTVPVEDNALTSEELWAQGELSSEQGDWSRAAELWRRVVDANCGDSRVVAFRKLAHALREVNLIEEAELAVCEGLKLYPNNVSLLEAKADNHWSRKDWPGAASCWREILGRGVSSVGDLAHARYARALRYMTRIEEAEGVIAQALSQIGPTRRLLQEAAYLAAAAEDWPKAVQRWDQFSKEKGARISVGDLNKWSLACQNVGDLYRAEELVLKGLARSPHDISSRNRHAMVSLARHNARVARIGGGRRGGRESHIVAATSGSGEKVDGIEELCSHFWAIERSLALASWTVNGTYPWLLIRMQLYYALTQQLGLYDAPHPSFRWRTVSLSSVQDIAAEECDARLSTVHVPISRKLRIHKTAAILMATRRLDGSEPYTDALRLELGNRALLLDRSLDGTLLPGAWDLLGLQKQFRTQLRDSLDGVIGFRDLLVCEEIRELFWERAHCDVGHIEKLCGERIVGFKALAKGFEQFFRDHPIETLYLTNSYGVSTRAALEAARRTGARVVELQHGFISRYHLGYSWPDRNPVPYMPDELWCFGEYWHESTPLPRGVQARVIGAPHIAKHLGGVPVARDRNLVLFTSQGVIGRRLFEVALESARRRPDKRVVFRLHPDEDIQEYEQLLERAEEKPGNFSISHESPVIFQLLAKAHTQVGVFSTTLLEGMSLGVRTIVFDLPGSEYMQPVVARGDALKVGTLDQLVENLHLAPLAENPGHYYAEPVSHLTGS